MEDAALGPRQGIAILVDWDNIRLRLESQGIPLTATRLMALARSAGRPVRCVVFADISRVHHTRCVELHSAGFTLVHCPRLPNPRRDNGKDTVDPAMVAEMHELRNRSDVQEILLASADRDFLQALSTLRNAAEKRVRIVTATPTDRQALVAQSDGAIAYAKDEESCGFPEEVYGHFMAGTYDFQNLSHARVLAGLTSIVAALVLRFMVNSNQYRFHKLTELLLTVDSIKTSCVTSEGVRTRLEFLKAAGVLVVNQGEDDRTYYTVDESHPFVRHVIPGDGTPTERSAVPAKPEAFDPEEERDTLPPPPAFDFDEANTG